MARRAGLDPRQDRRLLVYIVAGSFALKRARGPAAIAIAFLVAMVAVVYIVTTAYTKNPWGFLG